MHVTTEYLFVALILILIVGLTMTGMVTLMTQPLKKMEQQQLYTLAEQVLNTIILTPGDPPDWGETHIEPQSFGLALLNSRVFYTLDEEKVNEIFSGNYPPDDAKLSFGLGDDYGFSLTIMPVYNITIDSTAQGFTIHVMSKEGYPLHNVNITGYYLPDSWVPFPLPEEDYVPKTSLTNWEGEAVLDFEPEPNYVLIICSDFNGVKVMETMGSPLNGYFKFAGNYVIHDTIPILEDRFIYSTESHVEKPIGGVFTRVTLYRYVMIEDFTYYVEFTFWRTFE